MARTATKAKTEVNRFDVVIVGAGISGISAAFHLQKKLPGTSYAILEGRKAMGGTWDLFRYPGIRSDSDMHTMGFDFKPWTEPKAISDGADIRKYIEEAAEENRIAQHIHFEHRLEAASWDSERSQWTLDVRCGDRKLQFQCGFLQMCVGYYAYGKGYLPEFPGSGDFSGTLVHPQHWPEDLDYSGKKVVIIGSGATAVTLLPAMARKAGHVTMLQRSPTYMVCMPSVDSAGVFLRRWLPDIWVYRLIRLRNILFQRYFFWRTRVAPEKVRNTLLNMLREEVGDDMVEKHFTPSYAPWDQRLCLVPDSDFFQSMRDGRASVVTDEIDSFTKKGIRLKSGEQLDADIIVTATGLNMQILQEVDLEVDGEAVVVRDCVAYKGAMLSNVPNLAFTMGYSNASWTLKADLTSRWVCRLLGFMQKRGYSKCVPALQAGQITTESVMNLSSGYVQRAMDRVPKQGTEPPWKLLHNYLLDRIILGIQPISDGVMHFSSGQQKPAEVKPAQEVPATA